MIKFIYMLCWCWPHSPLTFAATSNSPPTPGDQLIWPGPVEPPPTDQHCLLWSWPQGEVGSNPTHQEHNTLLRSLLLRGLVNKRLFCKYSDKTVICKLFWYTVNCGKRAELKKKFWVKIFCSFFAFDVKGWIYGEDSISKGFFITSRCLCCF